MAEVGEHIRFISSADDRKWENKEVRLVAANTPNYEDEQISDHWPSDQRIQKMNESLLKV